MINKLKIKLKKANDCGLFHDSRTDVNNISKVVNELISKVNELIDKVNQLEKK